MFSALLFRRALPALIGLLPLGAVAQQPAPSTAPTPTAAPAAATDVIVRTNGDEIPARVLVVTPGVVRYQAAGAGDTLNLARQDVFMVRYANGTKEVLENGGSAKAEPPSLLGLTAAQRYEMGRSDARKYYKPSKGVFWGTFGATFTPYVGFLGGLGTGIAIAATPPKGSKLVAQSPQPQLLSDPNYYRGYRKQAQNRKLGKAAAGFGAGAGAQVALAAIIVAIVFSSM